MIRVVAPHFTAAVVLDASGRITRTAPILAWAVGWTEKALRKYVRRKGWTIDTLDPHPLDGGVDDFV
jgi:hypothetical protein